MGWTTLHKRALVATASLFIFIFLLRQLPPQLSIQHVSVPTPSVKGEIPRKGAINNHTTGDAAIDSLHLTWPFEHRRREIRVHQHPSARRSRLLYVDQPFLQQSLQAPEAQPTLAPFSQQVLSAVSSHHTIDISVPQFTPKYKIDSSKLLIGASTTLGRLNSSCVQWARWLAFTNATVVVIIQEELIDHKVVPNYNDGNWTSVYKHVSSMGINAIFVPYLSLGKHHDPRDGEAVRHLAISEALYMHRQPWHDWFVVIDDDTFFSSLGALHTALAPYDPLKPQWIGAMTENWLHNQMFGRMAYGGAGMILSLPTLKAVVQRFPHCNSGFPGGDMLFRMCIEQSAELTKQNGGMKVELTELPGLRQLDLWGDLTGFYESGPHPLLSVHHFNSWHHHPMMQTHLVADVAGPEAFLQRYRFADDVILTNGFSITQYAKNITIDLGRVEATFDYVEGQFEDALGPLREKCVDGVTKTSWRFERSVREESERGKEQHGVGRERIRQLYVRREANETLRWDGDHPDSVFELVWVSADVAKSEAESSAKGDEVLTAATGLTGSRGPVPRSLEEQGSGLGDKSPAAPAR